MIEENRRTDAVIGAGGKMIHSILGNFRKQIETTMRNLKSTPE